MYKQYSTTRAFVNHKLFIFICLIYYTDRKVIESYLIWHTKLAKNTCKVTFFFPV